MSRRANRWRWIKPYDLVVNGLVEAKSRRPLQYLKVLPAGKTEPLKIDWVGAFNHPLDEPAIRIKFTDDIDPSEATPAKIRIEPAVAEMKLLASGDEVEVKGKFDLAKRYSVTISPDLKGERGYGLTSESHWNATFRPKEASIIFPSSQIFVRARQDLRFSFFQINAPAVTWRLAQIPLEKLGPVTARVREFERNATDPVTGKVVNDPRTGFAKQFQTELLVDAFNLPVVGSGTFDATSGDANVRRDIHCAAPKTATSAALIFWKQVRVSATAESLAIARLFAVAISSSRKNDCRRALFCASRKCRMRSLCLA